MSSLNLLLTLALLSTFQQAIASKPLSALNSSYNGYTYIPLHKSDMVYYFNTQSDDGYQMKLTPSLYSYLNVLNYNCPEFTVWDCSQCSYYGSTYSQEMTFYNFSGLYY